MAKAPDGIYLLKQIDALIRGAEGAISDKMQGFQDALIKDLVRELNKLLTIQDSDILQSAENMKSIKQIRALLDRFFSSKQYLATVREAVTPYDAISQGLTEYFALIAPDFEIQAQFVKATIDFYKNQTIELLAGEGVNTNIKAQLERIIFQGIENGAPLASLEASTAEYLAGVDGALVRYSKQVTTDTLNTFSRAYTEGVAEGLGLEHYYYSGTEIKTTRDFCDKRIGKYFTKAEVEAWASQKWAGKKAGTNKDTIYKYLGGYNCRHKLLPVTEIMYNRNK